MAKKLVVSVELKRADHGEGQFREGDQVEFLYFMGGGRGAN